MLIKIKNIDAFIPNIAVGQILSSKQKNNLQINKYPSNKKKFENQKEMNKKKLTMMSAKMEKEILTVLNEEFEYKKKDLKVKMQSISPNYRRLFSILIFSSSILLGYVIAPSRNKIISLGFSSIFGIYSFFFLKKINSKDNLIIKKKIIQNLINENNKEFPKIIDRIQKEYKLPSDQLKTEIYEIYQKYLEFLLRDSTIHTEEIEEIIKLKNLLNLSQQEIGNCHYKFSQELYKTYIVMKEREDSVKSNSMVRKFFFISDRIFSLDTPKGYQYESARIRKIFLLTEENIKSECTEIGMNLYKNLIKTALKKDSFKKEELNNLTNILGLNEKLKTNINSEFFENKINEIITQKKIISEKEKEYIETIRLFLEIPKELSQKYLDNKIGPFFSEEISKFLDESVKEDNKEFLEKITDEVIKMKNDFFLTQNSSFIYFLFGIQTTINKKKQNLIKFMKGKKAQQFNEEIEKSLILLKNLEKILPNLYPEKNLNLNDNLSTIFIESNQGLNFSDLKRVYYSFLNESLSTELSISSENENKFNNLKKIIGISDNEASEIYITCVEPIFQDQLKKALELKNYNQENKDNVEKLVKSLKIEQNIVLKIKLEFYKLYLKNILSKEKFPTIEEENELEKMRKFFSLKWKDVQEVHDFLSEPKYQKSMLEAMGATGIIPANYWTGLENLRKKLKVSEKKAKEIFYSAIKEKLRLSFEKAIIENKKKIQGKENENNDLGDDPNIVKGAGTALGIEVNISSENELLNIVDLYSKNNIFVENDMTFNETDQNKLCGLNGRKENKNSTKSKINYIYPVNINGLFKKKIITEMYRDYLIECFSSKTQSEKRKLFMNLEKLGPILGLDKNEIENVHSGVGSVVYKQYLVQVLTKGFISKPEMAFLSNIQATLNLSSAKCSEFIREAKKNKISFMIESVFSSQKIDPVKVSEIRKIAKQLGVDLSQDLEISNDQKSKLFKIEIDSAIEKGQIDNQNQELIREIQSSFGLDDDLSRKILFEAISQRCENHLLNATASLRKNAIENLKIEIEKMLNFGTLLPVYVKNSIVSKKERIDIFSKYQTENNENLTEEDLSKKINLLKIMLGID
jgi:hypothetical protein